MYQKMVSLDEVLVDVLPDDHLQVEVLAAAGVDAHAVARILEAGDDAGNPDAAGPDLVQATGPRLRRPAGPTASGRWCRPAPLAAGRPLRSLESFLEDDLALPGRGVETGVARPAAVPRTRRPVRRIRAARRSASSGSCVVHDPADQFLADGTVELGMEAAEVGQQPEQVHEQTAGLFRGRPGQLGPVGSAAAGGRPAGGAVRCVAWLMARKLSSSRKGWPDSMKAGR